MDITKVTSILENEKAECVVDFIKKFSFFKNLWIESNSVVIAELSVKSDNIEDNVANKANISVEAAEIVLHDNEAQTNVSVESTDVHESSQTGDCYSLT